MRDKVILVGQMGAGKSTAARLLAERWPGFAAVDLDQAIEARAGRSLTRIFAEDGEPAFRHLEAALLDELLARDEALVIATGGGAPCQPGALERMQRAGVVIWLRAPPDVLAARAIGGGRPLLQGMDLSAAERFLSAQLEARRPFYQAADLVIDATPDAARVVSAIDQALAPLLDSVAMRHRSEGRR